MYKLLTVLLLLTIVTACAPDQIKGNAGTNGQDGTQIKVVQFCPGTSVYPTTFPEVGLCIDNNLYGVFWMNNSSYMAEIPPGAYQSTSTSLPCSFTVQAGCIIE